jgi:uncharacterized protein (DUF1684 family)
MHGSLIPFVVGALLVPTLLVAAEAPTIPAANSYESDVNQWHAQRVERLQREGGWLTLVGLYWLDEGENKFGSDPGNHVILPAGKAPAVAGSFVRHGKQVTLQPAAGLDSAMTTHIGDAAVTASTPLKTDADGEPTEMRIGPLTFFVISRGDRLGIRVRDSQAPALATFHGIDRFPIEVSWRIEARFEPFTPPKQIPITNVLGMVDPTPSPGAVVFEHGGQTFHIDALVDTDDGRLFLIFKDQTSGKETYGAGRFLYTDAAPKDGKVVLDFNKAYNPPCAFSTYATCPLPPPQNRLALRIDAGEKAWGHGAEHAGVTP